LVNAPTHVDALRLTIARFVIRQRTTTTAVARSMRAFSSASHPRDATAEVN